MSTKKIAIACQGGGSHTAFTAGALQQLMMDIVKDQYQIVGLTGTSGGAICATAAWYGLARTANGIPEPPYQILMDFWQANTAQYPIEQLFNSSVQWYLSAAESGLIPTYPADPYKNDWIIEAISQGFPRSEFFDFKALLEQHIDFEELRSYITEDSPRLLISAVNILDGSFKTFDSHKRFNLQEEEKETKEDKEEICVEALLASAAMPSIFKAVKVGESLYWDGLFSQNPPVATLLATELEKRPDEIWVIRINPEKRDEEPNTPSTISDRRNELSGNISLHQELHFIEVVNRWIEEKYFDPKKEPPYKPVTVRKITMSKALSDKLTCQSKSERDAAFINMLIEDGQKQAKDFIEKLKNTKTAKATRYELVLI